MRQLPEFSAFITAGASDTTQCDSTQTVQQSAVATFFSKFKSIIEPQILPYLATSTLSQESEENFINIEPTSSPSAGGYHIGSRQTLTDFGPITSITIPLGWSERDGLCDTNRVYTFARFAPDNDADASLTFYQRSVNLSAESSTALAQILRSKAAIQCPEILSTEEICNLSDVFGATCGDNQYSNLNEPGQTSAPTFRLNCAFTYRINGKTLILVEGDCLSPPDVLQRTTDSCISIFIDAGSDWYTKKHKIIELNMTGSRSALRANRRAFRAALQSIIWA